MVVNLAEKKIKDVSKEKAVSKKKPAVKKTSKAGKETSAKKKTDNTKNKKGIIPTAKVAADKKSPLEKNLPLIEELTKDADVAEANKEEPVDPSAVARGDKPMTIVEHLAELRKRIIKILISFIVLFFVAFYFSDPLIAFINAPFEKTGNMLNVFTLAGGIMVRLKIAFAATILLTMPLILFQLWRFVVPAIERPHRFLSRLTTFFTIIMFYMGAGFVFFTLPLLIKLLLSFIDTSMNSTIGADDYLHFLFFLALVMGFLFELPIVILILTRMGILTPHFLIRNRKYAVIIILIVSAAVTSGSDLFSLPLIAAPLMLLYEVTIVLSRFMLIRKKRKELMMLKSNLN